MKPRWWTGWCKCSNCGHRWMGVVEMREEDDEIPLQPLECSKCRKMTGVAE